MLGKLLKYEWKASWKFLLPMNLIIIVMTMFGSATIKLSFFDSENMLVVLTGIFILLTYVLSMVVVFVATMIFLIYRAYKSVYGEEGYLLHTLPIDKHHIIVSKTLMSALWIFINTFLIYVSLITLSSSDSQIVQMMVEGVKMYAEIVNTYEVLNGFDVVMTLVAGVVAVFAKILKFGACISLGQLSSNHKILASVGFYYAIYFVQNMLQVIYFVIVGMMTDVLINSARGFSMGLSWSFDLISNLIYCTVFYALTWYVMEKRLNLE